MRFTPSVSLATVSLDPSFRFFGPTSTVETVVVTRLQGASRVVHQSAWNALGDGQSFHPGNDMVFKVPAVDQHGWEDEQGNPATPWSYTVHVVVSAVGRSPVRWSGTISPGVASRTVSLSPSDGTVAGVVASASGSVDPDTGYVLGGGGVSLSQVAPGVYELNA